MPSMSQFLNKCCCHSLRRRPEKNRGHRKQEQRRWLGYICDCDAWGSFHGQGHWSGKHSSFTDVVAVDINMGCPKLFTLSGGMGAALLSKPELIHDILTTLKRNLDTPVTCKIRLVKSSQDTVELARRIEKAGVSPLAVDGRLLIARKSTAGWREINTVNSKFLD